MEFIYPKEQALEIAKHATEPVLTTETAINLHDLGSVTITAQEPIVGDFGTTATAQNTVTGPSEQSVVTPPVEEQTAEVIPPPAEEQSQIAQTETPEVTPPEPEVTQPAETEPVQTASNEPEELPRTAGELPLVGLIGMLCLGLGLGLEKSFSPVVIPACSWTKRRPNSVGRIRSPSSISHVRMFVHENFLVGSAVAPDKRACANSHSGTRQQRH